MKIEVGKWYTRRSGVPVKIVRESKGVLFPFTDDTRTSYQASGKYFGGEGIHANDLIREWNPDTGCELVKNVEAKFKPDVSLFDRVRFTGLKMPLTGPQIEVTVPTPQPVAEEAHRPHKHAEAIKAWADGKTIEYKGPNMTEWKVLLPAGSSMAQWRDEVEYRVKQEPFRLYFVLAKNTYSGELWSGTSYQDKELAKKTLDNTVAVALLSLELDRETFQVIDSKVEVKETQ